MDKIEKKWEYFGETNPYFAVATFDKFKSENLSDAALTEFFESGEEYVERIWQEIENNFKPEFKPKRALDFGCGVGRITLPLARRCETVIGIDISENMLKEARQNAAKFNLGNVNFVKGDNDLTEVKGEFDFIHSFIVFQHIKPNIGEAIFKKFVEMLTNGGIGVLHFTYSDNQMTMAQKIRFQVYRDFSLTYKLRNFLKRKNDSLIPMYLYDLNRLLLVLQENDCHKCQIRFSQHGAEGALLFFQKRKEILY
jgi:2-polyprenyl-3-methyl-5-hydroxy-6-metoxy-1,4-benzoquinol methylase